VENQSITYKDPTGLVKWAGSAYSASAAALVGATYTRFELTSECVNGQRATVHIDAVGPTVNLGLKVSFSLSDVAFDDYLPYLDTRVFNGVFLLASAGVTFGTTPIRGAASVGAGRTGLGIGLTIARLGNAFSLPFWPGPILGRDFSIGGTIGSSTVTYAKMEPCTCR
jgi:hypothetical protein